MLSYCCSFYGSQLWGLGSSGFRACCIQWNKAERKLLHLSNRTHTWLLGPLLDKLHISSHFCIKTLRFVTTMCNNTNKLVSHIGNVARYCALSPVDKNIAYLRYKFGVDICDSLCVNIAGVKAATVCTEAQQSLVNLVKNLLSVKNGTFVLEGFDDAMIDAMLQNVCCE